MQLVGELPLEALDGLLSYAEEQEAVNSTRGIWLAQYIAAKMCGIEPVSAEAFFGEVLGGKEQSGSVRSPEEIEAEFDSVIAADKAKRREG